MKKTHTQAEIDELMATTFTTARDPRSPQYRQGVRAMLEHRLMGQAFQWSGHQPGSCELDAYFAGQTEGLHIATRIISEQKAKP